MCAGVSCRSAPCLPTLRGRQTPPLAVDDQGIARLTPADIRSRQPAPRVRRRADQLASPMSLPTCLSPLRMAAAATRSRCRAVRREDRNTSWLAQRLLDVEALGALMSSRLMPPKVGSMRAMVSISLSVEFVELDVEHVDAGELLEQAALAPHHRLARQRADVAQPSTAVPLVMTATSCCARSGCAASRGSSRSPGRLRPRPRIATQVALGTMALVGVTEICPFRVAVCSRGRRASECHSSWSFQ